MEAKNCKRESNVAWGAIPFHIPGESHGSNSGFWRGFRERKLFNSGPFLLPETSLAKRRPSKRGKVAALLKTPTAGGKGLLEGEHGEGLKYGFLIKGRCQRTNQSQNPRRGMKKPKVFSKRAVHKGR